LIASTCIDCGARFRREYDQTWKVRCYACWKDRREVRPAPEPAAPIPPEMLRRLLQLCHPDRHANSVAANTATRWLLDQRQGSTQ